MVQAEEVGELQDTSAEVQSESSLGSKEHVDAALKKASNGTDPNAATSNLLAGKFKSRDALIQGVTAIIGKVAPTDEALVSIYKTFESKLGGGKPAQAETPADPKTTPQNPEPKPNVEPSKSGDESSEPSTEKAGVDMEVFAAEFSETGKLTDDSYGKLEKAGFRREIVDTYLDGVRARAESLFQTVGGKDKYVEMLKWSVQNIPTEEQQAFDQGVTSADPAVRKAAVEKAWKRYTDAVGNHPAKSITPSDGGYVPNSGAFRSTREMIEAQKDPRYGKDPAYTQGIINRLKISRI